MVFPRDRRSSVAENSQSARQQATSSRASAAAANSAARLRVLRKRKTPVPSPRPMLYEERLTARRHQCAQGQAAPAMRKEMFHDSGKELVGISLRPFHL